GRSDGQPDPSEVAFGEAFFFGDQFPGFSAVVRNIDAGAFAPAVECPGFAAKFPHSGDDLVWVIGSSYEVRYTGLVVDVQGFFPGFAAVGGFENSALFVWPPGRTQSSNE